MSNLFNFGGGGGGIPGLGGGIVEDPKALRARQAQFRRNLFSGVFNVGSSFFNRNRNRRMQATNTGYKPPIRPGMERFIRYGNRDFRGPMDMKMTVPTAAHIAAYDQKYGAPGSRAIKDRPKIDSGPIYNATPYDGNYKKLIEEMKNSFYHGKDIPHHADHFGWNLVPIGERAKLRAQDINVPTYDKFNNIDYPDTNLPGEVVGPGDAIRHRVPVVGIPQPGTPGDPLYGVPKTPPPFQRKFDPNDPVYNPDGSLADQGSGGSTFNPNDPVYNPDGSLYGGNTQKPNLGMKPAPNPADVAGPPGSGPYMQFERPTAPGVQPFDPGPMREPRMPYTMNMPLVPSVLRHLYPGGTGFGYNSPWMGPYGAGAMIGPGAGIGGGGRGGYYGGYPGANRGYGQGRQWHLPGPPATEVDKDGNAVVRPPQFYDRIKTPWGDKTVERSLPGIGERMQGRWRADNRPPGGWTREMMDRGHMPIIARDKARWSWKDAIAGALRGTGKNMGEGRWSNANVGRGAIAGLLGDIFGAW